MPWLDQSGLTLYMLRQLHKFKATDVLPPSILRRVVGNLVQNRRCLDHIVDLVELHFGLWNQRSSSIVPAGPVMASGRFDMHVCLRSTRSRARRAQRSSQIRDPHERGSSVMPVQKE